MSNKLLKNTLEETKNSFIDILNELKPLEEAIVSLQRKVKSYSLLRQQLGNQIQIEDIKSADDLGRTRAMINEFFKDYSNEDSEDSEDSLFSLSILADEMNHYFFRSEHQRSNTNEITIIPWEKRFGKEEDINLVLKNASSNMSDALKKLKEKFRIEASQPDSSHGGYVSTFMDFVDDEDKEAYLFETVNKLFSILNKKLGTSYSTEEKIENTYGREGKVITHFNLSIDYLIKLFKKNPNEVFSKDQIRNESIPSLFKLSIEGFEGNYYAEDAYYNFNSRLNTYLGRLKKRGFIKSEKDEDGTLYFSIDKLDADLGQTGTRVGRKKYKPYEEAKKIVCSLNIKTHKEYEDKVDFEGLNIPSNPYFVYRDIGWESWPDYFGLKENSND